MKRVGVTKERQERIAQVQKMYHEQRLAPAEIAKKLGCSKTLINRDIAYDPDAMPRLGTASHRKLAQDVLNIMKDNRVRVIDDIMMKLTRTCDGRGNVTKIPNTATERDVFKIVTHLLSTGQMKSVDPKGGIYRIAGMKK